MYRAMSSEFPKSVLPSTVTCGATVRAGTSKCKVVRSNTESPDSGIDAPKYTPPTKLTSVPDETEKATLMKPRELSRGESDTTSCLVMEQIHKLTPEQREILRKTFKPMQTNALSNGLKVYIMLLAEHPNYRNIWPRFRAIPDSSLMNSTELRSQASVYMCAISSIIDSLEKEDALTEQMNRIAKAHIKWNIHRSHVKHMLIPLLDVVKDCNGYLDKETEQAWTTLYEVIAELIEIFRARAKIPEMKP